MEAACQVAGLGELIWGILDNNKTGTDSVIGNPQLNYSVSSWRIADISSIIVSFGSLSAIA
mgnify:CR=1 FL=1